jgi:hypothetical protein
VNAAGLQLAVLPCGGGKGGGIAAGRLRIALFTLGALLAGIALGTLGSLFTLRPRRPYGSGGAFASGKREQEKGKPGK